MIQYLLTENSDARKFKLSMLTNSSRFFRLYSRCPELTLHFRTEI
jgi:hypothetical protein